MERHLSESYVRGRRAFSILLLATLLGVSVSLLTPSRPADAAPLAVIDGEALDLSADRLEVDVERGTARLQGNVTASFGDVELRCPTVEIRYDRSPRVSFARGTGGVTARLKGIEATADALEFDATSRRVSLSGGVRLTYGKGWVRAERAAIDIGTGKVSLDDVKGSIPVDAPRH